MTHVIPFSSFHRLQRTDSAGANAFNVPLDACAATFASRRDATLLPAFVAVDCTTDAVQPLAPPALDGPLLAPEAVGDHWSAPLAPDDLSDLRDYFGRTDGFRERVGSRVGRTASATTTRSRPASSSRPLATPS